MLKTETSPSKFLLRGNTFFNCGIGVWTQGFILHRQGLYYLTYVSSPFSILGGAGTQVCHIQSRCSTACDTPPTHFTLFILDMESWDLYARIGLKPWSSWPQPPKQLGLQAWTTGSWELLFNKHCKCFKSSKG
jgi:hypothetical protein